MNVSMIVHVHSIQSAPTYQVRTSASANWASRHKTTLVKVRRHIASVLAGRL